MPEGLLSNSAAILEVLKIIPGAVLLPFSMYFAWTKIGSKLSASYSVFHTKIHADRISNVIIVNMKDRPVTVYSIYALINKETMFEIEKLDPPLIVKGFETVKIETKPHSIALVGQEVFNPNFIRDKIDIYISTGKRFIKAKRAPSMTSPRSSKKFRRYRFAFKSTTEFNGLVYNQNAKFAITYLMESGQRTAFVDSTGLIHGNQHDWRFHFNQIPEEHLENRNTLIEFFEQIEFKKYCKGYNIDALDSKKRVARN